MHLFFYSTLFYFPVLKKSYLFSCISLKAGFTESLFNKNITRKFRSRAAFVEQMKICCLALPAACVPNCFNPYNFTDNMILGALEKR